LFKTAVPARSYGRAMNALMERAATPTLAVLRGIATEQLDAPTPCRDFTVRALISHLLQWGPMLVAAGHKQIGGPASEEVGDGWLLSLEAQTADLVAAWSRPEAWQGSSPMGGPSMPAPTVGGLVLGELVVHGWDLARATGQSVSWPDDVVTRAYAAAEETAEQGRAMGMYGPAIALPAESSTMDRLLGVTGRDPQWTIS
jgi:uncharacterized protein (TIGR03086 family)